MEGYTRAMVSMTLPVMVLSLLGAVCKAQSFDEGGVGFLATAFLWGLLAPPCIAMQRARVQARITRIALDEAFGVYTMILIITALMVFAYTAYTR